MNVTWCCIKCSFIFVACSSRVSSFLFWTNRKICYFCATKIHNSKKFFDYVLNTFTHFCFKKGGCIFSDRCFEFHRNNAERFCALGTSHLDRINIFVWVGWITFECQKDMEIQYHFYYISKCKSKLFISTRIRYMANSQFLATIF